MLGLRDPYQRSILARYGIALVSVSLMLAVKMLIEPYAGGRGTFLLFAMPVALSALYGGFYPAMFAAILAVLQADEFLLDGKAQDGFTNALRISFFLLEALFIAGVIESLHTLRRE